MNGFICVNKAAGESSAREVSRIKKLAATPCGHMGTLDPMADGVLPVAIGKSARLFDYFLNKSKEYIATFRFGTDSDTLDITGNTVLRGDIPDEKEIIKVLPSFTGEIMQVPPKFSAKNVGGKRGYQLARAGVEFELPPKKVSIYSIDLLGKCSETDYKFRIVCGGGTYIRSLARDVAIACGAYAVMSALTRTASGPFKIENSVKTSELTAENFLDFVIPADSLLPFGDYFCDDETALKLFNGVEAECELSDGIYKIYAPDGSFYGLAEVRQTKIKVRTKLC